MSSIGDLLSRRAALKPLGLAAFAGFAGGGVPPAAVAPPACPLGPGGAPNACADNPAPAAGSTINVTLVGAAGRNVGKMGFWYFYVGTEANFVTATTDGTYPMTVPNVPSDKPLRVHISIKQPDSTLITTGQDITVQPSTIQTLGVSLPAAVNANPFTPAHTIAVCHSGCAFSGIFNAIAQAESNGWTNVLITVEPGDYQYIQGNSDNNSVYIDTNGIANIWLKGIIGGSGTDGTVFPHVFGDAPSGGSAYTTLGPGNVTIDNFEFGPWTGGFLGQPNAINTTLRNVYIHDCGDGAISSDTGHGNHNLEIDSSHFARCGGGGGPEHNVYAGTADDDAFVHLKYTLVEQAQYGNDVKSRAKETDIDCSKIILNQDPVMFGSQVIDTSEGRVLHITNSILINGDGSGGSYSDNNSFDIVRYGAGRLGAVLANNNIVMDNNLLISDSGSFRKFINLYQQLTPSPPYAITNNKFVFKDTAQYNNGTSSGTVWQTTGSVNTNMSAVVYGNTEYNGNALQITLGGGNLMYQNRAAASLPAIGTYPKSYNDPAFAVDSVVCATPIGNVKIPAS